MDDGVAEILDTCLARLAAGASIEDCLAVFPEQRAELESPLRAAVGLMRLPHPVMSAQARAALETKMLASARARRAARLPARAPWWRLGPSAMLAGVLRALGYGGSLSAPWLRLGAAAVALVLALVLGAGAYAAARALVLRIAPPTPTPALAPTPILLLTPAPFTIEGLVERADQEAWVVDGTTVLIDTQTQITGAPALSGRVRVTGILRADGARIARSISVVPAATPTLAPTSAATPTPFIFPTVTPAPAPTQPPAPIVVPSDGGNGGANDKDKQCQGLQKGRDEKKCNPNDKGKGDDKSKGGGQDGDKGKGKDDKGGGKKGK